MVTTVVIDVVLIDDDIQLRDALAALIDDEPGLRCVRQFSSVEEALAAPRAKHDVVLLDIHLPGMLGSVGVAALLAKYPDASIMMLTVDDASDRVFEAICNGAHGFLLKSTSPERIIEGIRAVAAGGAPISAEVAAKVLGHFRQLRPASLDYSLTTRELELLALLANGRSYLDAAHALGVTINTIRKYVRSVYDKLHVHTKSEAVAKALKHGLIS